MKRISLGVVVAILIAYLFTSWRFGFAIEKQVDAQLEQIKGKSPYIAVVTDTYRRGWFVSEQDLTIGLFNNLKGAPAAALQKIAPLQIGIHNIIWHGPICGLTCIGLARIRTHVDFGAALQPYLASAFGSAEPLHIVSTIGFDGAGSGTVTSPAIKDAVLSNGARIGWGGLDLQSELASDYNSYSLHASIPKLSYASADGNRLELDDSALVGHSKRALRTLYTGDSNFTIGRMSLSSAKAGGVVFNNLQGSYSSQADNGYMNMGEKISIGTLTASSLNFNGAHFDFSFNHLQMDSLEQLSAAMQKVNQDSSVPPAQRGPILLAAMKKPGIAFLSHGPQFALERFSLATGGGEARLNGTVTLNDVQESDFADGADPKAILQKLEVAMDLSIDDAFLNGLPNGARMTTQLQSFADQGLATHANGKFHTKIAFHQGMMTFDDKAMPQPAAPAPAPAPRVARPPAPVPRR